MAYEDQQVLRKGVSQAFAKWKLSLGRVDDEEMDLHLGQFGGHRDLPGVSRYDVPFGGKSSQNTQHGVKLDCTSVATTARLDTYDVDGCLFVC